MKFSPILQLNPRCTQGQKTSPNYHKSYHCTTVWRIKIPCVHRHQTVHIYQIYKMLCKNSQWQQSSCKRFWPWHHKNSKGKYHYITMAIILYSKEPTKHNNSNWTQTLQWIQKCQNWSSQMGENDYRYRYKIQSWSIRQRKRSTIIGLHYHWYT